MSAAEKGAEASNRIVVVDLGKKKSKQVKRLRKGGGRLMDRVHSLVGEMQAGGEIGGATNTIVVVIEKKKKKSGYW